MAGKTGNILITEQAGQSATGTQRPSANPRLGAKIALILVKAGIKAPVAA
jgi:hypothetical protein